GPLSLTADSWLHSSNWSSGTPSTTPSSGTNFVFPETNNESQNNYSEVIMPGSLIQATGSGTSTWTLQDNNTLQYSSSLILWNQGQIFVNSTNNYTAATGTTSMNWTMTGGSTTVSTTGNQIFQNDGALNVIG